MPNPHLSFATLHERLTAVGCHVGVELDEGGHAIVVQGLGGRVLRAPVVGGFDRTTSALVMSGALREQFGTRDIDAHGWLARGEWPELLALALVGAA